MSSFFFFIPLPRSSLESFIHTQVGSLFSILNLGTGFQIPRSSWESFFHFLKQKTWESFFHFLKQKTWESFFHAQVRNHFSIFNSGYFIQTSKRKKEESSFHFGLGKDDYSF